MNDFGNRCVCGHEKNEHVWIQKSVSKLEFLRYDDVNYSFQYRK